MHARKISIIGLGYVGLPMAVEFGKSQRVIAFDINHDRISELKNNIDRTLEISVDNLIAANLFFTFNSKDLKQADFHIIAVPTPIDKFKQPDLRCLFSASELVGGQLKKGDIVVYESTVYPGATEEECLPILEKFSKLKCGIDFFIGYSPERVNPGDKEHSFKNICKIVAGQTPEILNIIANVYLSVVIAGVHKVSSIKVAEAAKIIENTQRDVNIALINEFATIFKKMNIDTSETLTAASTKWNFLSFKPGLVGGHCIGVDPYYLAHKANILGVSSQVILAGRKINESMGKYIVEQTIKKMISINKAINGATIAVLGLTFKENYNDIRNSRTIDIIRELRDYHINVLVHDPMANFEEVKYEYNVELSDWDSIKNVDVIILAVAHNFYLDIPIDDLVAKLTKPKLLIDIKSILDKNMLSQNNVEVWRL